MVRVLFTFYTSSAGHESRVRLVYLHGKEMLTETFLSTSVRSGNRSTGVRARDVPDGY
jgi:hypothetical protein